MVGIYSDAAHPGRFVEVAPHRALHVTPCANDADVPLIVQTPGTWIRPPRASSTYPTPELPALALMLAGLLVMAVNARRRKPATMR